MYKQQRSWFKKNIKKYTLFNFMENCVFHWIYTLIATQMLFYVFALKGGILFGVFPSFVALHQSLYQLIQNKKINLNKYYLKAYRENFKISNIIGYGYILLFFILTFNLNFSYLLGNYALYFHYLFTLLILIFIISFCFTSSIQAIYRFNLKQYFKLGIAFSMGHLLYSVVLGCTISFAIILYYMFPILFLAVGISCIALASLFLFILNNKQWM